MLKKIICSIPVIIGCVALSPMLIKAATKDVTVPITKDYSSATINVAMEAPGTYSGTLTSPKGDVYECTVIDESNMSCTIEKITAGDWKLSVTDDTQEELPKISVSMSAAKATETTVVDNKNIVVGKDIAGLKIYFKDDDIVITWTDESVGRVKVQIVDLDTNETIANETVDGQSYTCAIPASTKRISVNIVPSSSSNVSGAVLTYTYDIDNHPDATVNFPDMEYTNNPNVDVTIEAGEEYTAFAEVNGSEQVKDIDVPVGETTVTIPMTEDGNNEIKVYIVDENGNMRSTSRSYILDTVAPELTLAEEYDNMETYDSTYTITGTCVNYDTFQINGEDIDVTTDGTFSFDATLHEGTNTIVLTATDVAGNEASYEIHIIMLVKKEPVVKPEEIVGLIAVIAIVIVLIVLKIRKKKQNKHNEDDSDDENEKKSDKKSKTVKKDDKIVNKKKERPKNDAPKKKGMKQDKKQAKENSKLSLDLETLKKYKKQLTFVGVLVGALILFNIMLLPCRIVSDSMAPTLNTGDLAVHNRLAYVARSPQRGEVITFKVNGELVGKRIIGIAGDTIAFHDGYVYLNGQLLDESAYLGEDVETNSMDEFTVPEGTVFVLGDNRENSEDSRFWNDPYVPIKVIEGKLIFVIPLSNN